MRIFPAYYFFLGCLGLASVAGVLPTPLGRPWPAWSYLTNFFDPQSWVLGHTWSLSVEEQFYLVWPFTLSALGLSRGRTVAIAALAIAPVVRCLLYLWTHNGTVATNFNFDFLAGGCLLALYWPEIAGDDRWSSRRASLVVAGLALLTMLVHMWFFEATRWRFLAEILAVQFLEVLVITLTIAWCVIESDGRAGRLLNHPVARGVGVMSYSTYLWQQVFLRPDAAVNLVFAVAATAVMTWCSYRYIELPVLELRNRLFASIARAPALSLESGGRDPGVS